MDATRSLIKTQCEHDTRLVSIPVVKRRQHSLNDAHPKNLHGHVNRDMKKEIICSLSPATCFCPWPVKEHIGMTGAGEAGLVTFP